MKGFKAAIEARALENSNFRKVLYTSEFIQLVIMSIPPGGEIGTETHPSNDQFFRVEGGWGKCIIDGNEYELQDGDAVIVPRGARHNVINASKDKALKLYTIYSPPHHKDGIVRKTKEGAESNGAEFDGETTEPLQERG